MGGLLKSPKLFVRAPSIEAKIIIAHGSDWNDSFQIKESGVPFNLTDRNLQLVVSTEHEGGIRFLTLDSRTGDIIVDEPETGKVQIYCPYYRLIAIPTGEWRFHMRIIAAAEYRELMRGPLIVLPAEY